MTNMKKLLALLVLLALPARAQLLPFFPSQQSAAVSCSSLPALTGDVTTSAGSCVTTVVTIDGQSITLSGGLTTSGSHNLTFTLTGDTNVILPTTGTLVTIGSITSALNTALPSITTSQVYGGTGGAGVAQAFSFGTGLSVTSQTINCLQSTASVFGCVKPDGVTITASGGVLSSSVGGGTVTSITCGGGLTCTASNPITGSGTITPVTATSSVPGIVQGDGSTLTITAGVIACTTATASQLGCARPDNSTITIAGGVLTATGGAGPSYANAVTYLFAEANFGGL